MNSALGLAAGRVAIGGRGRRRARPGRQAVPPRPDRNPQLPYMARLFGSREVVLGAATLLASGQDPAQPDPGRHRGRRRRHRGRRPRRRGTAPWTDTTQVLLAGPAGPRCSPAWRGCAPRLNGLTTDTGRAKLLRMDHADGARRHYRESPFSAQETPREPRCPLPHPEPTNAPVARSPRRAARPLPRPPIDGLVLGVAYGILPRSSGTCSCTGSSTPTGEWFSTGSSSP